MAWWEQLGKDKRGSRPRCVLLMDGDKKEVANRLNRLVGLPDEVVIAANDRWMPYGKPVQKEDGSWDTTPAKEARLHNPTDLLAPNISKRLKNWWLAVPKGATPNWDIASTCCIRGKPGLLLVEAKAHGCELDSSGKSLKKNAPEDTLKNHEQIGCAIAEAAAGLRSATGRSWKISRDKHYQLSNRFAWSWKLASLGIPVVLLYLGFLEAKDMADDGPLFRSVEEWERVLKDHCQSAIDNTCWEKWMHVNGVPLLPLIRVFDQPFQPCGD